MIVSPPQHSLAEATTTEAEMRTVHQACKIVSRRGAENNNYAHLRQKRACDGGELIGSSQAQRALARVGVHVGRSATRKQRIDRLEMPLLRCRCQRRRRRPDMR
jgi:hypothetical protein